MSETAGAHCLPNPSSPGPPPSGCYRRPCRGAVPCVPGSQPGGQTHQPGGRWGNEWGRAGQHSIELRRGQRWGVQGVQQCLEEQQCLEDRSVTQTAVGAEHRIPAGSGAAPLCRPPHGRPPPLVSPHSSAGARAGGRGAAPPGRSGAGWEDRWRCGCRRAGRQAHPARALNNTRTEPGALGTSPGNPDAANGPLINPLSGPPTLCNAPPCTPPAGVPAPGQRHRPRHTTVPGLPATTPRCLRAKQPAPLTEMRPAGR